MLKIKKLKLVNFRSWKDLEFTFKDNVIYAFVGRNGSGKSSIRMGIQYALTGTIPKLTASSLVNTESKAFKVVLECDYKDRDFVITRTGKKASLFVDGKKYNLRDISVLNNIKDFSSFIFLTHETSQFVDLPEYKRKEMLGNILHEVSFLRNDCYEYSKSLEYKCKDKMVYINSKLDVVLSRKFELEERLSELRGLLENELVKREKFEQLKESQAPFSEEDFNKIKRTKNNLYVKIENCKDKINLIKVKIKTYESKIKSILIFDDKISHKKIELENVKSLISKYTNLIEDYYMTCPSCGEDLYCKSCGNRIEIDSKKKKNLIVKLEKEKQRLALIEKELDELLKKYEKQKNRLKSYEKKLKVLNETLSKFESNLEDLVIKYNDAEANIERYNKWVVEMKALGNFDNSALIDELKYKISQIEESLEDTKKEEKRLLVSKNVLKSLQGDFNTLASLFRNTFPSVYFKAFLQKYNACVAMFSEFLGIDVAFVDEGDKIITLINGRPYNYASTGEQQRAKIATTLGFSVLYTSEMDMLVLDEVFDLGLDIEGIYALRDIINNLLIKKYSKIILISHNQSIFENLSSVSMYEVYKENGCSFLDLAVKRN